MIPSDWPETARAISAATSEAVDAARACSAERFDDAVAELGKEDPSQVGSVHAEVIRTLLEELHTDGLTGEDVQDVLARTVRSVSTWMSNLDIDGFVEVLTGALGVADTENERPRPRAGHAVLIIADLVTARRASVDVYIRRAISEIERAQTMEMP